MIHCVNVTGLAFVMRDQYLILVFPHDAPWLLDLSSIHCIAEQIRRICGCACVPSCLTPTVALHNDRAESADTAHRSRARASDRGERFPLDLPIGPPPRFLNHMGQRCFYLAP